MSTNEEIYRRVVNAVPEGIWLVDLKGQTTFCNERMAEILGTDVESLQKLSCFDPVFPEDLAEAQHQFAQQLTGRHPPFDFRLRRLDGAAVWVSISCRPVYDDGVCTGLLGLFTDIGERKKAESGLRDSEELFRAIFSQAAVGITQLDVTGAWRLVNDRFCEIVNYTRAELRGKTVFDLTHPDDRETCVAGFNQLLQRTISTYSADVRFVRKYGATIWARMFVTPVGDAGRQTQYFITVIDDVTAKVQAEQARQEIEQYLALAHNTARLGVWDSDLRANRTAISPEHARLHGFEPDRGFLTPQEWMNAVHPADRERVKDLLRETFERTHVWDAEFRTLWPDGSVHWVLAKGKEFLDDHGVPVRLAGVSLDITQRKQTEEALRVSQQRLELAQGAGGIGIWDWDAATGQAHCSSGYGPLYGFLPDQPAPSFEEWFERILPEDRSRVRAELGDHASHYSTEFRVVWPDGTIHWLHAKGQVTRDSQGNPIRIIGVNMDVSEHKRAEVALRESEERFRRVFEDGPIGLALVGRDYHFVKANNALCQMLGYSEDELRQTSFVDITHPDDVQADVDLAARLFRREIPFFKMRKRYIKKNREIIWVNLTASVLRDDEGQPIHGLAMVEDITEIKRSQEEAFSRQKLESIGVLAGGIAHDFNNLLGSILASTELAMRERSESSAVDEELQRIKTASMRGAEIVRELMLYSGNEGPAFEPVDISVMVSEMLQLLKVSISKHTILQTEFGQNLPPVFASPTQIRQVVMNLVTNASDAIGARPGIIRVTTAAVKVGPDLSPLNGARLPEGDHIQLEVSDTGCGMTPEVQGRIFDPFYTTKEAGRGLGLAAVQGIIRSHGGALNVTSAAGKGSCFQVLLPCIDREVPEAPEVPPAKEVAPASPARAPGGVVGTVLVVEDEEILRLAVSKMLRRAGMTVIEAGEGSIGVDLFRANESKIDVVLLDVTLPGMSGREVLEEMRRIQPSVKVILTTAFSQDNALALIGGQDPWGYIRKPYQLSELTSLLREAFDQPETNTNTAP